MKQTCIKCIHSSLDEEGDLECMNKESQNYGDWVDEDIENDCDDFTGGIVDEYGDLEEGRAEDE